MLLTELSRVERFSVMSQGGCLFSVNMGHRDSERPVQMIRGQ